MNGGTSRQGVSLFEPFLVLTNFCVAQLFNTDVVTVSSNDLNHSNSLVRFLEYAYDLPGSTADL
jgi:hypothetical protein